MIAVMQENALLLEFALVYAEKTDPTRVKLTAGANHAAGFVDLSQEQFGQAGACLPYNTSNQRPFSLYTGIATRGLLYANF